MRLIEVEAWRSAIEADLLANLLFEVRSSGLFHPLALTVRSVAKTSNLVFNTELILILHDDLSVQSLRHKLLARHTLAGK
jgi:hypothetical protein